MPVDSKPAEMSLMPLNQAGAFLIFALVAAITPGPSNAMILATGSAVGAYRGIPCVLGAASGMSALLFCGAMGVAQLIIAEPALVRLLNWCGAAFLLYMAWRIARAGRASDLTPAKPVGFREAALFQWVNPKGWLVAVGAAATYFEATSDRVPQALILAALFFVVAFASGLVWLLFGAAVQMLLRSDRSARVFNIAMAAVLAASVATMLR